MSQLGTYKGHKTTARKNLQKVGEDAKKLIDEYPDMSTFHVSQINHVESSIAILIPKLKAALAKYEAASQKVEEFCLASKDPKEQAFLQDLQKEQEDEAPAISSFNDYVYLLEHKQGKLKERLIELKQPKAEAAAEVNVPMARNITDEQLVDMVTLSMHGLLEAQQERLQRDNPAPRAQPQTQLRVKLPKFEIQKFNGNIMEWTGFWAQFKSAVHDVAGIKPIDKFHYLRSHLEGEPKAAITGYDFTPDNYDVVVAALQERYGRNEKIIESHFNALYNIRVPSGDSIKLRSFYDEIERHLRTLDALDEDIEQKSILTILKRKVPADVMAQMERFKPRDKPWNMARFRKFLKQVVQMKEDLRYSELSTTSSHDNRDPSSFEGSGAHPRTDRPKSNNPKSTGQSLVINERQSSNGNQRGNPYCAFCQQSGHNSYACKKFSTAQARLDKLWENKLCYKCFKQGHTGRQCTKSNLKCYYCRANNHNSALCRQEFGETTQRSAQGKPDQNKGKGKDKGKPKHKDPNYKVDAEEEPKSDQFDESAKLILNKVHETALLATNESVAMQTALVTVKHPSQTSESMAHVMFDTGTNRAYVAKKLADKLQLPKLKKVSLQLSTFGSQRSKAIQVSETCLHVKLKDGSHKEITAYVVPQISGSTHRIPYSHMIPKHMADNYQFADTIPNKLETIQYELLIGQDFYFDFMLPQRMEISPGLFFQASTVGWLVAGRFPSDCPSTQSINHFVHSFKPQMELETTFLASQESSKYLSAPPDLDLFHKLEVLGIEEPSSKTDEENATQQFNETVKKVNDRFEVAWPWKVKDPDLPSNYSLALNRFRSVAKRLEANPELLKKYDDIIQNQVKLGIIELVTSSTEEGPLKHYVPHHPVESPTSTYTKVRIVYDASEKTKKDNLSLNDCLYAGSNLIQDLCGLHIRFRIWMIAIIADIEKAFLNIGLQIQDRDVTRFFWFKDPTKPRIDGNIQVYRVCRIPFGVTSSPFLLASTINYLMETHESPVANQLKDNIYVDNVITGAINVEAAMELYNESQVIFKSVSLNLREWSSNSKEFIDQLPSIHRAEGCNFKVLGIKWNTEADSLTITGFDRTKFPLASTKREVLQAVASVYDPLGFFSPVTLVAKIFLHLLWDQNYDWDDKLPPDKLGKWQEICKHLCFISDQSIPRYIPNCMQPGVTYQLLCFCDASVEGYATVVYLRTSLGMDHHITLLFSKTRLSPPKKMLTIPRLELLAALVGKRSLNFVADEFKLPLTHKFLWSDSKCVLHWIKNSKKTLSVFVENRVKEIRKTEDITYRYVKATSNPADLATRGCTVEELNESIWWHGPTWLQEDEATWPDWDMEQFNQTTMDAIEAEARKNQVMYEVGLVVGEGPSENPAEKPMKTPFGIERTRYSSLNKLYRITVYCVRFIAKCSAKRLIRQGANYRFKKLIELYQERNTSTFVLAQEVTEARFLWDKAIQQHWYGKVFKAIKDGSKHNIISQLGVRIDSSGLLRCHGRFENATLSEAARKPKLLPTKEYVSRLIVEHIHKISSHLGVSHTLSLLHQEYWLQKGRQQIRTILGECTHCKKFMGGPFRLPAMAPWPKERMIEAPPFTVTGLDYFGPLYVKDKFDIEDRKVWVSLYTCIATRAVHLELIEDMTTKQFLMCFQRFVARHGKPEQIISDNATQLKLAKLTIDKAWSNVLCDPEVQSYVATSGIKWKFIIQFAPWTGGFYERMVGIVKSSLRKAIGPGLLTTMQLLTLLAEVQAIVNSRPLVYINDDVNSDIALTPAYFLGLNPRIGVPTISSEVDENDPDFNELPESSAESMLRTWKNGQKLLERFWKLWKDSYLLSLRERTKTHVTQGRNQSSNTPKPGDVILIKDNLPRASWKLGKIQSLITSRDGAVRSATILLSNRRTVNRPINLLFPIECPAAEPIVGNQSIDEVNQESNVAQNPEVQPDRSTGVQLETVSSGVQLETASSRPQRSAAIRGRETVRTWVKDLVGLTCIHRQPDIIYEK